MGAKIGSFLATLMLSIPLAAVGLMAVFGVPQLAPLAASPEGDGVTRNPRSRLAWPGLLGDARSKETSGFDDAPEFASAGNSDDFSDFDRAPQRQSDRNSAFDQHANSTSTRPSWGAGIDDRMGDPRGDSRSRPDHWAETSTTDGRSSDARIASARDSQSVSDWPSNTSSSAVEFPDRARESSMPTTNGRGRMLSWREASLRLSELGIQKYHLEPGVAKGDFLFVCLFTPGDAPHVTHRFESEADDPLVAVNQVLSQVENWMNSRFASQNFPPRDKNIQAANYTLTR